MTDKHRPRFVVPSQGGRTRGVRAGDVRSDVPTQQRPPEQAQEQAQEQEGRFRALFENAPLGVALCDLDGRFAEVNPSLRDLLAGTGIDPDGGGLADLARHHPEGSDEATAWRGGLADVRAGRIPVARAELTVTPPDATPRWLQATTALIVLGGRRYLLSHLEDTTARRLAELAGPSTGILLADRLAAASTRDLATGLHTGVLTVAVEDVAGAADALRPDGAQALLAAVSERLVGLLRAGDAVAPLDGEEFGVIAPDVPDEAALAVLVDRIERALAEPLDVGRFRLCVTVSVGAVLARPGESLADALRRTGQHLAHVRRARRAGPVDVRETDLRETDLRETDLRETDLRETDLRGTDRPGGEVRDGDVHERPA